MNLRHFVLLGSLAATLGGCVVGPAHHHRGPYDAPDYYYSDDDYYDYRATPSYEGYYYVRVVFIGDTPWYVDDDRRLRPIPPRLHSHFRNSPYRNRDRHAPAFSRDGEVRDGYAMSRIVYYNDVPYYVEDGRAARPLPNHMQERFKYAPIILNTNNRNGGERQRPLPPQQQNGGPGNIGFGRERERNEPPVYGRERERNEPPVYGRERERNEPPVYGRERERNEPPVYGRERERNEPPVYGRERERNEPPVYGRTQERPTPFDRARGNASPAERERSRPDGMVMPPSGRNAQPVSPLRGERVAPNRSQPGGDSRGNARSYEERRPPANIKKQPGSDKKKNGKGDDEEEQGKGAARKGGLKD